MYTIPRVTEEIAYDYVREPEQGTGYGQCKIDKSEHTHTIAFDIALPDDIDPVALGQLIDGIQTVLVEWLRNQDDARINTTYIDLST